MKARVIITLDCPRACEKCCNKEGVFDKHIKTDNIQDFIAASEIMITGGEPLLNPQATLDFIYMVRAAGFKRKLYLYTAYYPLEWADRSLANLCLANVDGVQFTLHNPATRFDIGQLQNLTSILGEMKGRYPVRSCRLVYDPATGIEIPWQWKLPNSTWDSIKPLIWRDNCPLPTDEKLFWYQAG